MTLPTRNTPGRKHPIKLITSPATPDKGTTKKEGTIMPGPALKDLDFNRLVTIVCQDKFGEGAKLLEKFTVHKSFICFHSKVYRMAFTNERFEECRDQRYVEVPESLIAFRIFFKWIYSPRLENIDADMPGISDLVDIWVLAEMKDVPALQNQAIIALNDHFGNMVDIPTTLYHHVYDQTRDGAKLRKFVASICVGRIGKTELDEDFPQAFLLDFIHASQETKFAKGSKITKDKMQPFLVDEVPRAVQRPIAFPLDFSIQLGDLDPSSSQEASPAGATSASVPAPQASFCTPLPRSESSDVRRLSSNGPGSHVTLKFGYKRAQDGYQ